MITKSIRRGLVVTVIGAIAIARVSGAEAAVRLLTDGYYRPGRGMPILVDPSPSPQQLRAEGAVPIDLAAGAGGVVPMLMLTDAAQSLQAGGQQLALRPLPGSVRLIGVASDGNIKPISELFTGASTIAVRLDPGDPLPGPVEAWQSLDGVVLETLLPPPRIAALLCAGTLVAIHGSQKPDSPWNWRRVDEFWVARFEMAGVSEAISDAAYLPTQSWQPGASAALRRRIVLLGVLVSLGALATLTIRSPGRAAAGAVVTAAIVFVGIEVWRSSLSPLRVATGEIEFARGPVVQHHAWRYFTSSLGASLSFPLSEGAMPVVASADHASQLHLRLSVGADGAMSWRCELPPNARLAMQNRALTIHDLDAVSSARSSPMEQLARRAYLPSPSATIIGEAPAANAGRDADENWPTVLIRAE